MRLLLAEDDRDLVDTLIKDLQSAGYAVDVADNGVDAEYLGNEMIYDVAVLDLGLPQTKWHRGSKKLACQWQPSTGNSTNRP